MIGVPASCRNCFGRSLAIREPVPAAAMIAMFMKRVRRSTGRASAFRYRFTISDPDWMRTAARFSHLPPRAAVGAVNVTMPVFRFFPEAAENHLAGGGLQHTG